MCGARALGLGGTLNGRANCQGEERERASHSTLFGFDGLLLWYRCGNFLILRQKSTPFAIRTNKNCSNAVDARPQRHVNDSSANLQ